MIETTESKAEFEKRKAVAVAAMKSALRGDLPFSFSEENNLGSGVQSRHASSHGTTSEKRVRRALVVGVDGQSESVNLPQFSGSSAPPTQKPSRAAYMRDYRKREKKCPHCGEKL